TGGNKGNKQGCGFLNRFEFYTSSYLYLDNFIFTADKPAQASIGTHTVNHDHICEGEEIEFKAIASEGDFTFQLFNERNHEQHDFTGHTLSILPDSSTHYSIISTDINGCHTHQQLVVTVQQQPFIELVSGGCDTGVCRTFEIGNITYKLHNINQSSLTWDRAGTTIAPEGLTVSFVNENEYTISGIPQFDGGKIYTIKGSSSHPNCQAVEIEGSIHTRAIPEIVIVQGAENNCLGESLSLTLRNLDNMMFGSVQEEERVIWRISDIDTVSRHITHTIDSLSSFDQQRYYMDVKQDYCFFTDSIDIHIYEEVMPGHIDNRQKIICYGNTPPVIMETMAATTENNLPLYRWWRKANHNEFEIIDSANQPVYSPSDSEIGIYTYKREVSDGCNRWQPSEGVFTIHIIPPIVLENIKVASPIVCSGLKDTISAEIKYDQIGGIPQLRWEYSSDNLRWHQLYPGNHYRMYFTSHPNSTLIANLAFDDVLPAGYHYFRLVAYQPTVSDCSDTIGTRILFSRNTENDILSCQDNLIAVLGYGQCDTTFYTLTAPKLFQFDSRETEDSTIVSMNHDANLPLTMPEGSNVVVSWTVLDRCGFTHNCQQEIEVVYPACGDDYMATDIEGNEYQTVRIGCDCWMQENLKSTLYNDGSTVAISIPYYSKIYSNTEENEQIFGRLYTWHSAVNISENSLDTPLTNAYGHVEGVCPSGWYLPTASDFEKMTHLTANEQKSSQYWINNANGTAEYPIFNAKPGGLYDAGSNKFFNLKGNAYFWTSTTQVRATAIHCEYNYSCPDIIITEINKNTGLSLRCIKE
ncbi:MAG: FISUMP domain-containing protein, partial [Bacteroidales bacterium]